MTKLILAIIMFIGAGAAIFTYVSPTYSDSVKIKEDTALYQQALEKATEVQNLKRGLLAKLNEFSGANVERLEKLLPSSMNNVHLILDLDGMAAARGLSLSTVTIGREGGLPEGKKAGDTVALAGAVEQQRKFQSVNLSFSVVATYDDMIAFMRDIERSLRLVDLVALEIGPAQTPQQQGEFSRIPNELAQFAGSGNRTNIAQVAPPDSTYTFQVELRTYWLPSAK
jgi:Tfp pilus assembly protein PilO